MSKINLFKNVKFMKKLLLAIFMSISLIFASTILSAQSTESTQSTTPYSLSITGGYSWLTGALGGEFQFGNVGLAAGWMPTTMPLSGTKINSGCYAITYYYPENNYFTYASAGISTKGYQYEDTWGGAYTKAVTIIMFGEKWQGKRLWMKAGVGYGWCDEAKVWTGEITLGLILFGN